VVNQERVTYLFNSCYNDTASDKEVEEFLHIISEEEQGKKIKSILTDKLGKPILDKTVIDNIQSSEVLFSKIQEVAERKRLAIRKLHYLTIWIRIVVTLIIIVVILLGSYCFASTRQLSSIQPNNSLIVTTKADTVHTIAKVPKSKHGLAVIAHRGNHLQKAENSLAAIEEAIRVGADYVEIDVRTSKDGQLLLHHNDAFDIPNVGKRKVKDLTWQEIVKIENKGKDGVNYPIATLESALFLCKDRINIYLDFKDADVLSVFKAIRDAKVEKNILVYINNLDDYVAWRKIAPHMPLISALPEVLKDYNEINAFQKAMNWQAMDDVQDGAMIAFLKTLDLPVFLDAQGKDEGEYKWLQIIHKGVRGIQTDKPEALIEFLKKHNLRDGLK